MGKRGKGGMGGVSWCMPPRSHPLRSRTTTASAAVKGTAKGAAEGAAVADGEEATDSIRMVCLRMEGDEREEADVP